MSPSPLDPYILVIKTWIEGYKNNAEIVKLLKDAYDLDTSEASIRRCVERNEVLHEAAEKRRLYQEVIQNAEAPGVEQDGDQIIVTDVPRTEEIPVEALRIEDILRRRNLDPDEWEVKNLVDNQWNANAGQGTKITLYQFKVWLARKTPVRMVFPITEPKFKAYSKPVRLATDDTQFGIIVTDHQAPHIDEALHELTTKFIEHTQPDFGIVGGDGIDNGSISRHRDDPQWDVPVQAGLQSFFNVLYDYRNADDATEWTIIPGNHDDRIRNEILERAERLYGIRPAQWPGEEPEEWVMSLRHLLNLDRLGMNYEFTHGSYEFQQVNITALLAARHGHKVVKDGALKTAIELGHSVVLGHTHRQSVLRKTIWNSIRKQWWVITAIEAGCMCNMVGGLGFANAGTPDWQPGFATVTTFPDGSFTWDHAIYTQDEKLRWRDLEFSL